MPADRTSRAPLRAARLLLVALFKGALCAGTLCAGALCACSPGAPERPNLLLVVVDTLRADAVGAYGSPRPTTPELDRIAAEGVLFRRAFAHSGWTLASMASLLTGRLPHEHRVGRDPLEGTAFGSLEADVPTLAERLRERGYATGAIVNNTFLAPAFGLDRGFGTYDYRGATRERLRSAQDSVGAALRWLGERDEPWFLLLHLMEPHLSYDPPPGARGLFTGAGEPPVEVPFAKDETIALLHDGPDPLDDEDVRYVRALYDEEVRAVDTALGRLRGALERAGLLERTVLVVTADHGEEFFDHGGFEHGHTLYSELTRVPLVARGPGAGAAGAEVDALVSHRDLFRGLLALGGAEAPEASGGSDLFALARGDELAGSGGPVVSENTLYGPPRASVVDGEWRLSLDLASGRAEVWRLDERGVEVERARGAALEREERRLRELLQRVRGHLRPVEAVAGPHVPDMETFLQLESLGYVSDG